MYLSIGLLFLVVLLVTHDGDTPFFSGWLGAACWIALMIAEPWIALLILACVAVVVIPLGLLYGCFGLMTVLEKAAKALPDWRMFDDPVTRQSRQSQRRDEPALPDYRIARARCVLLASRQR